MKGAVVAAMALLALVVGCRDRGKAPGTEVPAMPDRASAVAPAPVAAEVARLPTAARGEATERVEADGGSASHGPIELRWDDGGALRGKLVLGADSYAIDGIRIGAEIRGWVSGDGTPEEASGRGTLFGLEREGRLSGEFVISTSGGETVRVGSWFAATD